MCIYIYIYIYIPAPRPGPRRGSAAAPPPRRPPRADLTMTFEQAEVVEETLHWLKGYRGVHDG